MSGGTEELTPSDVMSLHRLRDPVAAGDGFVFVVQAPETDTGPSTSDVWFVGPDGAARSVTAGASLDDLPAPSPDGRRLAFASDRGSAGILAVFGFEVETPDRVWGPVGEFTGSVEQIAWSADARHLLVLTADIGSETGSGSGGRSLGSPCDESGVLVQRPRSAWRRLHLVDVATGRSTEVGPRDATVWEFCWTGEGDPAAVVSGDPGESGWFDATVVLLDLEQRTVRTVYEPRWQVQGLEFSRDGALLAFIEAPQSDRGLLAGQVVVLDPATSSVSRPPMRADVTRVQWTDDGRIFWTGLVSLETACGFVTCSPAQADSEATVDLRWRGLATLGAMERYRATCDTGGVRVVAVVEALGRPPEVCLLAEGADDWSPLTSFNGEFAGRATPEQLRYTWRSRRGELNVEGLLLLPPDRRSDQPLPLVIWVHGGPSNAHTSVFAPALHAGEALVLTQRGCAVLLPNPRGSTGRGVPFTSANLGDLGGGDLEDLLGAIDALAESGLVDPQRVGIAGASYGGYLAAWAAVRTDAFAAAVPISSITDWVSHRHTSGLARFDDIFLGADPQDSGGAYLSRSPIMYARNTTTPTLLIHGDSDTACPVGQGRELFQALAETGCTVELVVYPDEGHEIRRPAHVLDACSRVVDWFATHLRLGPPREHSA